MDRNYEDLVQAIEFFLSQWFRDLTSVNGEYIITELQKEVNF